MLGAAFSLFATVFYSYTLITNIDKAEQGTVDGICVVTSVGALTFSTLGASVLLFSTVLLKTQRASAVATQASLPPPPTPLGPIRLFSQTFAHCRGRALLCVHWPASA